MPRALKLRAKFGALAAVEGAVAAARTSAGHDLELRERAHPGAAEPHIMKSALTLRIGDGSRGRLGDQDVISFPHVSEQAADISIRETHATMRRGAPEQPLVISAVEIDVALKRVAAGATVHALLEPVERKDAGEDEIIVAYLAAPNFAGRLAPDKHGAEFRTLADPLMHAMPAWRRPMRAFRAADARARGGDGPDRFGHRVFEPDSTLPFDVHHEQARGKLRWRAAARNGRTGKIERARGQRSDRRYRSRRALCHRTDVKGGRILRPHSASARVQRS